VTNQSSQNIVVKLIQEAVEAEGCYIEEVDIEKLTIRVNGPNDVVSDCARAVAEVLD
jgi:YbbR domain-containing protein